MLKVKNLHIHFKGPKPFHALQGISFNVAKGKTLALVGSSGSGKSLTSLAIMGLLPKAAEQIGTISLREGDTELVINSLSDKQMQTVRGKLVSMVFQEPMSALNPIISVGEQLTECILCHQSITKKEAVVAALNWLDQVRLPHVTELYHRYPHQLSGGQKQRVMIAMAMCNYPAVLIADEPTTALDVTVQKEVIALMKHLQKQYETALLFITHDIALAKLIADDFLILEKGKVVSNLITPEFEAPHVDKTITEPLITVNQLSVIYDAPKSLFKKSTSGFKAVDNLSFDILQGERLGLVGESGCGKSTLSKCILGLQKATKGQIWYKDTDLTKLGPKQWFKFRKEIQIIFQDPYASLNPRLKVKDLFLEPMQVHGLVKGADAHKQLVSLLDQVQLPLNALDKYPHEFSGGQRQRICIARALAVEPSFIVCDESVSALDVKIQAQILELLYDLQQQRSLTYLFITHDLSVVKAFCERVMVMKSGKIVEMGTVKEVLENPQEIYTQQLIAAAPQFIEL